MRTPRSTTLGVAAVAALTLSTLSSVGAATADDTGVAPGSDSSAPVMTTAAEALADAEGMTVAEARHQLANERRYDRIGDRLTRQLGPERTGGAYINDNGRLVITVTNSRDADRVREAGAIARTVEFSLADLRSAHRGLNADARRGGAGKVMSWHVDVPTNSVVVTQPEGTTAATRLVGTQRRAGSPVRVVDSAARNVPTADIWGGQEISMSTGGLCSLGFNVRTSGGTNYFLTAGHCATQNPDFYDSSGLIGSTTDYQFPGNDYAAAQTASGANPRGGVLRYDGSAVAVKGHSKAAIGSSICKSGRTTGWTCGTVQSYNNTVNYSNGDGTYSTVTGLTETNACTERGDSGGSNISGNQAQGLTSGGSLYGPDGVCGEQVGVENTSYIQPIGEVLTAYGVSLVTE